MKQKSIIFCFPYLDEGGVPNQFIRIGTFLESIGWEIFYVDYEAGSMATKVGNDKDNIIVYDEKRATVFPKTSYLVMQSMTPWSIFPGIEVSSETKVLFWTCHALNFSPSYSFGRLFLSDSASIKVNALRIGLSSYFKKVRAFKNFLLKTKALVFMDDGTLKHTELILESKITHPCFLPVPVEIPHSTGNRAQLQSTSELNLVWVGRIADFKYPILEFTLNKLNSIQPEYDRKLVIHVVGDGELLGSLKFHAERFKNLEIVFYGALTLHECIQVVKNKADIVMAMGTAALEGGAQKKPTILLDYSYDAIPDSYEYRWLHDTREFNLGSPISQCYKSCNFSYKLISMLDHSVENYSDLSNLAFRYVKKHHSVVSVANSLVQYLINSKCSWGELEESGVLRKPIGYRLYSHMKLCRDRVLGWMR